MKHIRTDRQIEAQRERERDGDGVKHIRRDREIEAQRERERERERWRQSETYQDR